MSSDYIQVVDCNTKHSNFKLQNPIESFWNWIKRKMNSNYQSQNFKNLDLFTCEFEFRYNHKENSIIKSFIELIREIEF